MMIINNSPIEILKTVVQKRNWHQGLIERRLAAVTKQNAIANKISHEKATAILELLGWQKVKEETWKLLTEEEKLQRAAKSTGEENLMKSVKAIKKIYPKSKKPMDKKINFTKRKG